MLSAFFAFVGCAHAPSLRERAECASWTVRVRSDVEKVEIGPADTAARQNGEPSYLAPYPELLPVLFTTALGDVWSDASTRKALDRAWRALPENAAAGPNVEKRLLDTIRSAPFEDALREAALDSSRSAASRYGHVVGPAGDGAGCSVGLELRSMTFRYQPGSARLQAVGVFEVVLTDGRRGLGKVAFSAADSAPRLATEWLARGGAFLRDALAGLGREAGEAVIEHLVIAVGGAGSRAGRYHGHVRGLGPARAAGEPVEPAVRQSDGWLETRFVDRRVPVEVLAPRATIAWEPWRPVRTELPDGARITYDFRLWKAPRRTAADPPLVAVDGLEAPFLDLQDRLAEGEEYEWTVRAAVFVGTRRFVTAWSCVLLSERTSATMPTTSSCVPFLLAERRTGP